MNNLIVSRIISAIEINQPEENQTANNRMHAGTNIRKALHSTPQSDLMYLSQLDTENWVSVLHGNSGISEWATRAANYGLNAYQNHG